MLVCGGAVRMLMQTLALPIAVLYVQVSASEIGGGGGGTARHFASACLAAVEDAFAALALALMARRSASTRPREATTCPNMAIAFSISCLTGAAGAEAGSRASARRKCP